MKTLTTNPVLIILLFSIVFISCQSTVQEEQGPDLDQLRSELQEMENAYASAAIARDAESVVNYYAEDAKSLPQNEPMIDGKSAILENLKQNYEDATNGSEITFDVVEVFAAGNLVIEIGKSTETDSDGNIITGKYMSLFENRDGKLVCIRDIWNNDAPGRQ